MKHIPLKTALLTIAMAAGLHAQTSSILIKSGDRINGTASNSAKLISFSNVTMNDLGGVAFQGYATEINTVTNPLTRTNLSVSYQYTNVLSTNYTSRFYGIVTNVISYTNLWNVNGATNAYVYQSPQIKYATNGTNQFGGATNTNTLNSFITVMYTPQGGHSVTNTAVVTTNLVSLSSSSYTGIWASDSNGVLNLMIRSGQTAGSSNPAIIGFTDPVLNNNGASAFIGWSYATNGFSTNRFISTNTVTRVISTNTFTNPIIVQTNSTIYLAMPREGSNNLLQVAAIGSPAPGTGANFTSFSNIALPDVGGVIFVGMAGTNQGVWVQNSDATLHNVAIRGQSMAVGGTNKVISSFNLMNNGSPGVTRSYSQDTGIITYQAYFTDGTSAAVRVNR